MACEALVPNAALRNLIREDKIHQMYGIMQTGQGTSGMQTMNQSLLHLVAQGAVDRELAEIRSPEPDEFRQMLAHLDQKGRR
jgi:twitching motility protein PilT